MAGPEKAPPVMLRYAGTVLAVTGFDPSVPNTARVYNRWLGGKDASPADRAQADRLLEIYPPLQGLVRENRSFVARAVTWAAGPGISPFLDPCAGPPASPPGHHAATGGIPTPP